MVKIVRFSMSGMCHGQNCLFQHAWNMLWSQWSVSACLECIMVKIVSFIMAQISLEKNPKKLMCLYRAFGRHFGVHVHYFCVTQCQKCVMVK
jgi:hypothetical protein